MGLLMARQQVGCRWWSPDLNQSHSESLSPGIIRSDGSRVPASVNACPEGPGVRSLSSSNMRMHPSQHAWPVGPLLLTHPENVQLGGQLSYFFEGWGSQCDRRTMCLDL